MKIKIWFAAATTVVALATSIASAHPVMFCRDCPFPAKISDGRWLMPNGLVTVDIDETPVPRGMNQVDVTLRDAKTGHVIAKGTVVQRRERRTANIDLVDSDGRPIKGFVRFVEGREKIQAKFTCEECNIGPMLE